MTHVDDTAFTSSLIRKNLSGRDVSSAFDWPIRAMKSAAAVTVIDLVLALYVCIFLTKPTALKQPMLSSTAQVAVRATPGVTIDMVNVGEAPGSRKNRA